MNNALLNAFIESKRDAVVENLKKGADKQIILDYVKNIKDKGRLTMMQGWILQEIHHVKNHGFGIWELC